MLDDLDRRILRYLQAEPDMPLSDLAERAATTPSVASRRLSRMRSAGTIVSKTVLIDWAALGYEVEVSLRVTLDKTQPRAFDAFIDAARDVPEVIEIQTFLGRVDVRLSVVARDMADYQQVYRDRILTLPHIAEVEALMHVARIKTNAGVPI
ncbi:MAG: Lrp/AsnC family transcriptional regulator [Paracoccaceae bacterium]|jgi:Lrp/AsnC family transcriptional regulator|nr:Lrp/AsnC family transcriptional regulator [Paracoccaceae bacterium]NCZ65002.1 Lrp/AsnC family transcriptional regulator [Paracoccaceae bacterium]NDI13993.1 Lrp/AsnC family transcriptional regulator [Paracoccaceae bacterium]